MHLTFKFFDQIDWSIYGTICVIIPFIMLILFRQPLNSRTLIFSSLIGMMHGDIIPRIIFTGFLNLLVYKRTFNWLIQSIIFVASAIICYYIPYDIYKIVANNILLFYLFYVSVIVWMIYILYRIYII